MSEKSRSGDDPIRWVVFEDRCAVLRRMVRSSGAKGLLLQFTGRGRFEEVRRLALESGFKEFGDTGEVYLMAPDHPSKFDSDLLAKRLGGKIFIMTRQEIESYPWTIDYTAPDYGKSNSYINLKRREQPEFIGMNFQGRKVYRDGTGRRQLNATDESGTPNWIPEDGNTRSPEFLRAEGIDDLTRIAGGLVMLAERGSVSEGDFQRVAKAATEPMPGSEAEPAKAFPEQTLRFEFLKQIVNAALDENGSRKSYHKAMKLAENAQAAVSRSESGEAGLSPSANFLIFLRRLNIDAQEFQFSGNQRLELAAPLLRADAKPQNQLHDLTTGASSGIADKILGLLAERLDSGTSTFLLSGSADDPSISSARSAVGVRYAIETVAEIAPSVAVGRHDPEALTLFMIGERRPEVKESLPDAARRTFSVLTLNDLDRVHTEILRSRRRIREFHEDFDKEETPQDADEDNRQRPYAPLSRVTEPFTKLPKSLDAATAKALRRISADFTPLGGVDAAVAGFIGVAPRDLGEILTSEQVDAVAMRHSAQTRNRGFLLGDQTGIGKGRSLAAMALQQLRAGGKVLYLTENAEINIRDVWRDLGAVGAAENVRPAVLAGKPVKLPMPEAAEPPPGKTARPKSYSTLSAAKRREVFLSRQWPSGCNMVLTNYSLFNRSSESPSVSWADEALDERTLLILDEAHNALNPNSNTGKAVRKMIGRVGRGNVVYATATPMRNPSGADLYIPLLPPADDAQLEGIINQLARGGETAQESFVTMLGEDGAYLRRDHDLSNLEFEYRLPNEERSAAYEDMMNSMTAVVGLMIDASLRVGALVGKAHSRRYLQMIQDGADPDTARTQCNAIFQHSASIGSPLVRLARITINSMKVDQVVEEAINEIDEGRKPLITFHSTGASLFNELAAESRAGTAVSLTMANQIARVADSIFKIRIDDEPQDARHLNNEIQEISDRLSAMIAELPDSLPASPVDAVIEKLAARGYIAGEISGRTVAYREGQIVRRNAGNRRSVVDDFNDGGIDVLLYNSAGATGGSYHASPEFGDPRPRSLIEMETPIDIIKYIQSQGRGNRYGQVARPRIVSVVTGLVPEMRILQQRNRKLRNLGASVDGNRSHPLLMDGIPDLLNVVGDVATAQILRSNPDFARQLAFTEFLSDGGHGNGGRYSDDRMVRDVRPSQSVMDSGASNSPYRSLANRALTRSLVLPADDQQRFVELIRIEFEAIVEELESQNSNPLRPKELLGEIEIHATTVYSGTETDDADTETSAFFAPLYLSTGTHHLSDDPIRSDQLYQMVERAIAADGADGFASYADDVERMLPTVLGHLIPQGQTIAEALRDRARNRGLRKRYGRLSNFIKLLRRIRPGVALEIRDFGDAGPFPLRTVVKLIKPSSKNVHLPQSYKVQTVLPGDSRPEVYSLSRLVDKWPHFLSIHPGLSMGMNETHLREFDTSSSIGRRYPVQVLTGNLLQAIITAQAQELGTMSLFREISGKTRRGIVIKRSKVDLGKLPSILPSAEAAEGLLARFITGKSSGHSLKLWIGNLEEHEFSLRLSLGEAVIQASPSFVAQVPKLSSGSDAGGSQGALNFRLSYPMQAAALDCIMRAISRKTLQTDGRHQKEIDHVAGEIERQGGLPPEMRLSYIAETGDLAS